jgi:hypothetical protein
MPLPSTLTGITLSGTFTNWHGNVSSSVPYWIMPRNAADVREILRFCVSKNSRTCVKGSSWSLSSIGKPDDVLVDLGQFTNRVAALRRVPDDQRNQHPPQQHEYFHVLGNTPIRYLNDALARNVPPYALETSGAANGQVIAGVTATGSHGAAIDFGAVHDALRAVCLITSEETACLVQPASAPFNANLVASLQAELGMSVTMLADDQAFGTAVVGLGAVGIVYSVVLEVEALYQLAGQWVDGNAGDRAILHAIGADDPASLSTIRSPFNVAFAFNPYAQAGTAGIWSSFLEKIPPTEPYQGPHIAHPRFGNAFTFWVAQQSSFLRNLFPQLVDWAFKQHYHDADPPPDKPLFPGDAFGDTTLVEGMGRGMEVAVHRQNAGRMLNVLLDAMRSEGEQGRYLPGAMGIRYVGRSKLATLAMNSADANDTTTKGMTFFEIGALAKATDDKVNKIFSAIRGAVRASGIPFTFHWGLENDGLTDHDLRTYFGANVDLWIAGRRRILPTEAQRAIFRNPVTDRAGLTR